MATKYISNIVWGRPLYFITRGYFIEYLPFSAGDWWEFELSNPVLHNNKPDGYCTEQCIYLQLDSIHNSGLRLALGAFCTSPVSSLYTEANEAPLEERRLKLSMHYYVKTRACIDNPAHHALHEFDRTTRDLYAPRPNGRGGMTRPRAPPIGLKIEEAMTSAEINAELVCPPEDTKLSTRNAWLRSQETRPHWRSK